MRVVKHTWREFRNTLYSYASTDRLRREQFLFRGQGDSEWAVQTTPDRERTFKTDDERHKHFLAMLADFRREAIRLGLPAERLPDTKSEAFELLARHHGLPSLLLDMSESPYVAAFFAYDFSRRPSSGSVAIWMVDRSKFPTADPGLEIIDDPELLRFNKRAIQQRGQFLRASTIRAPVVDLLDAALTKFEWPADDAKVALADLDEMGVNATTLFGDLDGAARTARSRFVR